LRASATLARLLPRRCASCMPQAFSTDQRATCVNSHLQSKRCLETLRGSA
jgi:hypothetical protein